MVSEQRDRCRQDGPKVDWSKGRQVFDGAETEPGQVKAAAADQLQDQGRQGKAGADGSVYEDAGEEKKALGSKLNIDKGFVDKILNNFQIMSQLAIIIYEI